MFKVLCGGTPLAPGQIGFDTYPCLRDTLTIFNYPIIERFKIERFVIRSDYWEHDIYEPVALQLVHDGVVATSTLDEAAVRSRPAHDLMTRLATVGDAAKRDLTDRLELHICADDFLTLCRETALPSEPACHAYAFEDAPMAIKPAGAVRDRYTAFSGFSDDMSCYWVTMPGGGPFIMDPTKMEVATAVANHAMPLEKALAWCQMAAQQNTAASRQALAWGFADMLSLIDEAIMPAYDGAQELTRISLPSQAAGVTARYEAARQERSDPAIAANDMSIWSFGGGDAAS